MKRIIFFFLTLAVLHVSANDDAVTISVAKTDAQKWELTVQLINPNNAYSAFQIDLQLPDGITLNTGTVASATRTTSLEMQAGIASNGLPRVVGYAKAKTNSIIGTRGTIFTASLTAKAPLAAGDYEIVAKNVRFTTASGNETVLPNATCTLTIEETIEYKLTYWNEDDTYYTILLKEGDPIPSVDDPAPKEGYSFCGWGDVPATMPAANLDLRAVWCVNSYELRFMVNGEVVHTEQVAYDAPLPEFKLEDIEGYTFCGWNDAPEKMPARNLDLTARYCVIYYQLRYMVEDQVIYSEDVAYGAGLPKVDAPEVSGSRFVGWDGEEHETMPAEDLTYTARYVKIGDVNQDGIINSADVVAIYNYIIYGADSDIEKDDADVNADTLVNSADVTWLYNIIMYGI